MSQARVQRARAALQVDPARAQAWVDYIEALIEDDQDDEARKMLALGRRKGLSGRSLDQLATRLTPGLKHLPSQVPIQPASESSAQAYINEAARLRDDGNLVEAVESYRKAITVNPQLAIAHYNLGNMLKRLGDTFQASIAYRRALTIDPDFFEAHFNLANLLSEQKNGPVAVEHYKQAIRLRPRSSLAHANLAKTYEQMGQHTEARNHYRMPQGQGSNYYEIAEVFHLRGELAQALANYRYCIALEPDNARAHYNSGVILLDLDRMEEAEAAFRQSIRLRQEWADAHYNLGNALYSLQRNQEAIPSFQRTIDLEPRYVDAYVNLGSALQNLSRHDEALIKFSAGVKIDRASGRAMSSLLFCSNYHPDKTPEDIYAAYQAYDTQFGASLRTQWGPHRNAPLSSSTGTRRLRLGYISPDFNQHAVCRFLEPLLALHDRARFEVFAYAELAREDAATARYRTYCDHFILTHGMSDDALASRIRADAIDVLVDVAGHTAGNRLLVFARKPAPVSLSWLGYGYTTGLKAIDYLLTDEVSAPLGSEHLFSETPWRLPSTPYVYRPDPAMGEVSALPALAHGFVTFGTLTRAIRINHRTVRVWAEILKRVPGSRLVIDSKNFQHASMQEDMAQRFAQHGIARERLLIGCHSPPWDTLRSMDIGLDCFPHNSGTTLFETLYMGVPYVTLAGRPSVGRLGKSVLTGLGQPQWLEAWCADSEQEYIDKAVALATDLQALAQVRTELRPVMQASVLMDEARFARKVEHAFLQMFERQTSMAPSTS